MTNYLKETKILNYSHPTIQQLINEKKWMDLDFNSRIKAIYNFVRDDIYFGYNIQDNLSGSDILKDGFGQCNTKATLLMTLFRAAGIPCRIHGFTIDKALQKGAISGIWYVLSPQNILHSWVEVFVNQEWFFLEGVILDKPYLEKLQMLNKTNNQSFCGYGAFTDNLENPPIDWNQNHTFIQDKGINNDFGVFDSPDDFYAKHNQELSFYKKIVFKKWVRHLMNKNVDKIRSSAVITKK